MMAKDLISQKNGKCDTKMLKKNVNLQRYFTNTKTNYHAFKKKFP